MKTKHLIMASILLVILTIGAASASEDADTLAVEDNHMEVANAPCDADVMNEEGDSFDEGTEIGPGVEDLYPIEVPGYAPYNSDSNITFDVDDDINGTIQIADSEDTTYEGSEPVYSYRDFPVTQGKGVIPLKDYSMGVHYFHFNFIGGDNAPEDVVSKINEYFNYYGDFRTNIGPVIIPKYVDVNEDVIVGISVPDGTNATLNAYYYEMLENEENPGEYYYARGELINKTEVSTGYINLGRFPLGYNYVCFVLQTNESETLFDDRMGFEVIDESHDFVIELESDEVIKVKDAILKLKNIPYHAEGSFRLYIDNNEVQITRNWNELVFDARELSEGTHNFKVEFLGDGYFNPTSLEGTFNASSVVFYIPETYDIGFDFEIIGVLLPKGASGIATIKFTDTGVVLMSKEFEVGFDGEIIYLSLKGLKYGTNNLTIIVDGTYSATKDVQINGTYSIGIYDKAVYGSGNLNVVAPKDMGAKMTLIIEGNEYNIIREALPDDGFSYHAVLPKNLSIATYSGIIRYSGDEKYPAAEFDCTVEVAAMVIVPESEIDPKNEAITLTLPENATGDLKVRLIRDWDGAEFNYTVKLEKGVAILPLKDLAFGKYRAYVNYTGDDYTIEDTGEDYAFAIRPELSYPTVMVQGDDKYILINAPGLSGGVEYCLDGGDHIFIRLADGKARILLSGLSEGIHEYDIAVLYDYDNDFGSGSGGFYYSADIKVQKPVIKAANANVVYTSNSLYNVQITGVDKNIIVGDKVTFKVNGKVIGTGKIDKNGYASIKITQKPGSYKITAVYKKASITKKLTVNHVLKLQKVKVKKSAKKLVIKATLVKVNGKYLKNKKITLKFNGKKYTAKTNKKGVAKFTIKSKVLKKLKKGKKVTYQATYLKDSVKYTVKVKK